jgi:SAM-dependent methyltransferase
LQDSRFTRWVCLEPDHVQLNEIDKKIATGEILPNVEIKHGDIRSLDPSERFNSILYLDVLEHIEDDASELATAYEHLLPGGHLIILSPAHQILYTPFDAAIGHHRRYNKKLLRAIHPAGSIICEEKYLDSFGLIATLANKLLLRTSSPSPLQILLWDSYLIPISKMMDRLFFWRLGKSILYIIQRPQ